MKREAVIESIGRQRIQEYLRLVRIAGKLALFGVALGLVVLAAQIRLEQRNLEGWLFTLEQQLAAHSAYDSDPCRGPAHSGQRLTVTMTRGRWLESVRQPQQFLSAATFVAYPTGYGVGGFTLDDIADDSLLRELGFRDGDLLCAVDGSPIDSMEAAWSLPRRLQLDNQFTFSARRGGQPLTILVDLVDARPEKQRPMKPPGQDAGPPAAGELPETR